MTEPTPRTDEFHQAILKGPLYAIGPCYRDFARTLERELAAARAAIKVAREAVKEVQQLAGRIREICQTEEFPKDAAWVPTISAHALVIGDYSTDTIDALAQLNTHAHE